MNDQHDWLELAKEAAETAADYRDRGRCADADDWHDIAMRRAAVAQADDLRRIADALEAVAAWVNLTGPGR